MYKSVVFATLSLLAFNCLARQGQDMENPLIRTVMNPKAAEELGLSAEQKEKLATLKEAGEAKGKLQKKIWEEMRRQVELLEAESIDEDAVNKSIDEVFELRKAMAKEQTKRLIEVRSILSPEQIKKAKGMIKKMRNRTRTRGEGFRKEK